MLLRPLRDSPEDAEAIRELADDSVPPDVGATTDLGRRARHLARHDQAGCWLAEEAGQTAGAVLSLRREGLWGVSLLAVRPTHRRHGLGRALLERAGVYGRGCLRAVALAPADGGAVPRYRAAGFAVHPAMALRGVVTLGHLPAPATTAVTVGSERHLPLLDSVDRRVRGAAHGPDHRRLLGEGRLLLVVETLSGSGYCFVGRSGPLLLAATSRRLATGLLLAAFSRLPPGREVTVRGLTAEQGWALDAGLVVGLQVHAAGFVCVRGMHPPAPYIPSAAYL